ncbi:hypothetical protein ACFL6X_01530 [Candidatus Latescibacterota bacterium]
MLRDLWLLSESRGREASGIAYVEGDHLRVYKTRDPASSVVRSKVFRRIVSDLESNREMHGYISFMGHCRLVTDGSQEVEHNNQPVIKGSLVGVHNGIVTNVDDLWREHAELLREYEVDTEIILSLLGGRCGSEHRRIERGIADTFGELRGAASLAVMSEDADCIALGTNNGSLYTCRSANGRDSVFASEKRILQRLVADRGLTHHLPPTRIRHCPANTGVVVGYREGEWGSFTFGDPSTQFGTRASRPRRKIENLVSHKIVAAPPLVRTCTWADPDVTGYYHSCREAAEHMVRCSRCILPETFPFISYDEQGVCSYCRSYQRMEYRGARRLLADIRERHHRAGSEYDCVVAVSGGRDSSYALHYLVRELDVKPLAYTYDWGMVTDLARRNVSRLCGELGVEHILVSADIAKKRRNIRKNVEAWLRRPHLGTVPLFMAGDKQFYYYANRVKRENSIGLDVWSGNGLERTIFKVGLCGIRPGETGEQFQHIPFADKVRLAAFYARQCVLNPAYLNSSLIDSAFAYLSYYFIKQENILFYSYIPWKEEEIEATLGAQYGWEWAKDTKTSWRIGDGTAAFYNYIYYTVAGFTENDTFRSNQVREGMVTREDAIERVRRENAPRWDAIEWYLSTIGLDCGTTVARINGIPRMY